MDVEISSVDRSQKNKTLTVDLVTSWQLPLLIILFVSVVIVAIKTVVHRHEARTSYMKLQTLEKERDKLAAQWSRLKLEQGVALNQVRVEQYARWDLNMKIPKASEIRMVREPARIIVNSEVVNEEIADNDGKSGSSQVALGD